MEGVVRKEHPAPGRANASPAPLLRQLSGSFFVNEPRPPGLRAASTRSRTLQRGVSPLSQELPAGLTPRSKPPSPTARSGDTEDTGAVRRDDWASASRQSARHVGLPSRASRPPRPALPGGGRRAGGGLGRSPRPHVRRPPGGGARRGGGAPAARARGRGGARSSAWACRALSFLPRPAWRAQLLPRSASLPPWPSLHRPFLSPSSSSSSSARRSSSSQTAWRPWRRGCARRPAAAARPSSSVPPASSWASRAPTSARR